ncbi:MAG TPA: alpha-L-rhamnosidase C-terminal domain-containing protein [Vicinamibacteria bacterium]|nr:alpha-L-rhamnosidase C-terminal domain-containing protein [Vicinamibacteria bacterium]
MNACPRIALPFALALVIPLAPSLVALASPATSGSGLPISEAVLRRQWAGSWIACPDAPVRDPGVFRFRKAVDLEAVPSRYVVHVSADQRFVLQVNGRRVGIGPSRGDVFFWRFETFDLAPFLKPGANLLSATVWSFGADAPAAQMTDRTGFVAQGDGDAEKAVNTDASWECAPEPGHQPWPEGLRPLREEEPQYNVVGPGERLDASLYDWAWAEPPAAGAPAGRWKPAIVSAPATPRSIAEGPGDQLTPEGRMLVPDELPPMEYRPVPAGAVVKAEGASVEGFPEAGPARVPPNAQASILLDRKSLVTAYPELTFSGGRGARIRLRYQEALLEPEKPWRKGHRDLFEGKRLVGYADEVLPDGGSGRVFHPLWWRTWRYLRIDVETAGEALTLDRLAAHFTGYPFEQRGRFDAGDATLARLWEVGWRTARSCAHETYVDCPYYEQLQYVGDTRVQALISYAVAGDDRLARQAIDSFDRSRREEGITFSRYPSAPEQFIPPFSLLWVGMVHDYWMWRDDPAFVRQKLAGTRTVLDWFTERLRPDGLLGRLPWWNFVDWCDEFEDGVPPQDSDGGSVAISLQLALALGEAADLEAALGEPARATRHRERAEAITASVRRLAWDGGRGLVADTPAKRRFSQQANILALLAGAVPPGQEKPVLDRLLAMPRPSIKVAPSTGGSEARVARASVYFRFYLARALEKLGEGELYLPELEPWREMLDVGLSTFAETPDAATRSDCHAWSAHPNYDLLRIVAGLKPGSPGFRTVRVEPHLGTLGHLEAALPHPKGPITVAYRRDGSALEARVTLPAGLTGTFAWRGVTRALNPGAQSFRVE